MTSMDLTGHVEEFKREGVTIFRGFMAAERVAEIRRVLDPEFARLVDRRPDAVKLKIVPLLGHEVLGPILSDHVLDPLMLDFAERVMGPFVQLDSCEVSGFPPSDRSLRGSLHFWHRDHFHVAAQYAQLAQSGERKPYTPPLACNCLTYLQDMNEDTGSLYLIPQSHLTPTLITKEREKEPYPRQRALELKAGDMVFLHHDVLHTGSYNTTSEMRYFISNYVCRIGLPHRDPFELPLIEELRREARAVNDRRVLRFFGEDDRFVERQEAAWRAMVEEDRAARRGG